LEGVKAMKNRFREILCAAVLLAPLFMSTSRAQEPRVTVLNPLGQPPAIARVPMAPRIASLEGKTIYIVDIGFTDTHQFFTEMQKLLSARYPKTNWIVRTKIGTYFDDDPKLWAEIKEKGSGMIMGVGH
jgi:hypothetical protein